jgi:hypothetical protein
MSLFETTISKILKSPFFDNKPPVLLDIGASGEIFEKWKLIADKSICIAFDADERDFSCAADEVSGYKKLYKFNRIVTPTPRKECPFYLTNSPYCSSTLLPDTEKLSSWMFAPLFEIERTINLESTTINDCLQNVNLDYIDWYKVDSQGIDLDLFLSIPNAIRENVLAADFEPGIMDAYIGENKLAGLLQFLDKENFWISSFDVKGTQRLDPKYTSYRNILHESPCWAGITSIKEYASVSDVRSRLLLIVFSLIENQWGHAIQICESSLELDSQFKIIHSEIFAIINEQEAKRDKSGKLIRKVKNLIKKVFFIKKG